MKDVTKGRNWVTTRGDIMTNLVENYELSGRLMLKMLTEDATNPAVRDILTADPGIYRKWWITVFAGLSKTHWHRRRPG